ncbi:tyrosine-type recombinase/integrase [bacterium]|nr:tyrosine-type recombinase/integrase [bacterium]
MDTLLTVAHAAAIVGASTSLIQKRCKDGTLPAIRVGKTYRVRQADLEAWVRHTPTIALKLTRPDDAPSDLLQLIDGWIRYLEHVSGLLPTTIATHRGSAMVYVKRLSLDGQVRISIASIFERKSVLSVFEKIPPKSFALKLNTFNALISLGKYLVAEGVLGPDALAALRPLKPRRQMDPRRTHLKPLDVTRLFEVILTRSKTTAAENLTLAAMVACMVYAGLRVSEVCKLRVQDVDFGERILTIRHGKGGKDRRVGVSTDLLRHLDRYRAVRALGGAFFIDSDGAAFNRHKLAKRMKQLARCLGVDITCHGLRRTFATLAANQGRSINAIRIALGHSDLTTTQAYLRQTEGEVVAAMRDW